MSRKHGPGALSGRKWMGFPVLFSLMLLLVACGGGQSNVQPTPTPTSVSFTKLKLNIPSRALNAPITGNVPDSQMMHVSVTFHVNQDTLNKLSGSNAAKQGDTSNASNLTKNLGITDQQYQQIKDFFGASDAKLSLSKTHTTMTVDAKAGSLAQLFQTKFVMHKLDGRTFYTPDPSQMPQVPSSINGYILAVTGLDDYSLPAHSGVANSPALSYKTSDSNECPPFQSPAENPRQIAHAYGFDQMWNRNIRGGGMTINVVEIDGVYQQDLQHYFSCVGYRGKFTVQTVGETPQPGEESTLDIEMIAGLAPNINIKDYQTADSHWTSINDELQAIIDDNSNNPNTGDVVSISIGGNEDGLSQDEVAAFDQNLKILMEAEHMTVFISSGDCGAFGDGSYGKLAVQFPSTDPNVVAVGGTYLKTDANGNRIDESTWEWSPKSSKTTCNNMWGSGGGLSTLFQQPSWTQASGISNSYSDGYRQVPDVSAIASYIPIYYDGAWVFSGGTSAATPIWATGWSLMNENIIKTKSIYFYGPRSLYGATQSGSYPFYDVTKGTNLYYKAGPGWDYATGLGTPNIPALYTSLLAKA